MTARQWTPAAAVAFIEARPGDADADAIIRNLAAQIRDREECVGELEAAADNVLAAFKRGHEHEVDEALDALAAARRRSPPLAAASDGLTDPNGCNRP